MNPDRTHPMTQARFLAMFAAAAAISLLMPEPLAVSWAFGMGWIFRGLHDARLA